jgi:hypothetical protein
MSTHNGITFDDSYIVAFEGWDDDSKQPFLVHHNGKALAVVFADDSDNAKEELAYLGKLDQFKSDSENVDALDCLLTHSEMGRFGISANRKYDFFDLSQVKFDQLPRPKLSLSALLGSNKIREITFADSDVIEWGEYNPPNLGNTYGKRCFLIHDSGFSQAVVFASSLQDALDAAVDAGKLDQFQIEESQFAEYKIGTDEETATRLGNAGEPFDVENVDAVEFAAPPYSFCKLFDSQPVPTGWDKV